jgi:hypothetical protein
VIFAANWTILLRVLEVDLRAAVEAEVGPLVGQVRLRDQHPVGEVVQAVVLQADVRAVEQVEGLRNQLQPTCLPSGMRREACVDVLGPGQRWLSRLPGTRSLLRLPSPLRSLTTSSEYG